MDKLAVLNKIPVYDYSVSSGEVEYVTIENTEENRDILKSIGASEEDITGMTCGDPSSDDLDITFFAFNLCDAGWWSPNDGFGYYD